MKRWTPKIAVIKSRRKLQAAIQRLREVACEWADVYPPFENRAEEFVCELNSFADQIRDEVQELLDDGQELGL